MIDTTPLEPIWSDNDIANDAKRADSSPTMQAKIRACLLFMRHGYEAYRQQSFAREQQLTARIDELENSIKVLYQSDGSRLDAFALGYNNGFDDASRQSDKRIAELEQALAEATATEWQQLFHEEPVAVVLAENARLRAQLDAATSWQPVEGGFEIACEDEDDWKLYASEGDIGVVHLPDRRREHYVYAEPHNIRLCRRTIGAQEVSDG